MSLTGQRLFFQPETGPRLYFILLFLTTLLAKEFTKGQFLAYVGRLHPIFSSQISLRTDRQLYVGMLISP